MVERPAVNGKDVGSTPSSGASFFVTRRITWGSGADGEAQQTVNLFPVG